MGTINELYKKQKYIKLHFVLRCIEVKGLETKYRSYNVLPSEMVSFYIFLTQGFDFDLILLFGSHLTLGRTRFLTASP